MSKIKNKTNIDTAREIFDYLADSSKKRVEEGGNVDSCLYAIMKLAGESTVSVFPVPIGDTSDSEERRLMTASTGELLAEKLSDVYIFVTLTEAWVSQQKKSGDNKYLRPREDPRRKEVLIISAKDCNGNSRNVAYEIKRSKTTKKTNLSVFPIFGKSQQKFMYEWFPRTETRMKIVNTLVDSAWEAYNKTKKLIAKK